MSTPVPDPHRNALEGQGETSQSLPREIPLGIAEIAQLLEVNRDTPNIWRSRGVLPEPDGFISGSPFWWRETVLAFAERTGRMPA